MIHGRPRHPQSQGLVEQANGTLEKMIRAMCEQFRTNNWVSLLPRIQFNLNTQRSSCKLLFSNMYSNLSYISYIAYYLVVIKPSNETLTSFNK